MDRKRGASGLTSPAATRRIWTVGNVHFGVAAKTAMKKDECKKGGWAEMSREDGSLFKNQGDCLQYVNTGK